MRINLRKRVVSSAKRRSGVRDSPKHVGIVQGNVTLIASALDTKFN